MRIPLAGLLSAAAVALAFNTASAQTTPVMCKDGTTSTATGKGTCSSHGGVASSKQLKAADKVTKAADKAVKTETKADTKAAKADAKTDAKAAKTDAKADAKVAKAEDKADATKQVKCTDGTMSKGGRGACSHHGGIAKGTK